MKVPTYRALLEPTYGDGAGLNGPCSEAALSALLARVGGWLPPELVDAYREHDGSDSAATCGDDIFPMRLLPTVEARELDEHLHALYGRTISGRVAWLWTDDSSNYAGVFVEGPLRGFVAILDHDEPRVVPAFRSPASLLAHILAQPTAEWLDVPSIPRELARLADDTATLAHERQLAELFEARYRDATGDDERRDCAMTFLALLPVADTAKAIPLLDDPDMWTPEAAASLLGRRAFAPAIPAIERLARTGRPNADFGAMRALVALDAPESVEARARLRLVSQRHVSVLDMLERPLPHDPDDE